MEKSMVQVVNVGQMTEREYVKRDGSNATVKSIELKLRDAADEFYAEATDEVAERIVKEKVQMGNEMCVQCRLVAREWKKQDGTEGHMTSVRILNFLV